MYVCMLASNLCIIRKKAPSQLYMNWKWFRQKTSIQNSLDFWRWEYLVQIIDIWQQARQYNSIWTRHVNLHSRQTLCCLICIIHSDFCYYNTPFSQWSIATWRLGKLVHYLWKISFVYSSNCLFFISLSALSLALPSPITNIYATNSPWD